MLDGTEVFDELGDSHYPFEGLVAKRLRHVTFNHVCEGSTPSQPTNLSTSVMIKPKLKIHRPFPSGILAIDLDDFRFVQIDYDYRYTYNAHQYSIARAIVKSLGYTDEEIDEAMKL
jgi:hypothetical protein